MDYEWSMTLISHFGNALNVVKAGLPDPRIKPKARLTWSTVAQLGKRVALVGCLSKHKLVNAGVPQGSIVGRLILYLYK